MGASAVLGKTWYVGLPDEKISRGTQSRSSKPRNSSVPCAWTTRQILAHCLNESQHKLPSLTFRRPERE